MGWYQDPLVSILGMGPAIKLPFSVTSAILDSRAAIATGMLHRSRNCALKCLKSQRINQ